VHARPLQDVGELFLMLFFVQPTDETGNNTSNRRRDAEEMGDCGRVEEFILVGAEDDGCNQSVNVRTGTLRCVITTHVSFPRIAIEVCPEPEIALNAYSFNYKC